MKKIYLLLAGIALVASSVSAATVTINVMNNVFVPNNLTINSGDTIVWMWTEGTHTTTSTSIPAAGIPWNAPIDQNNLMFMYVPVISGNYQYQCNFHPGMVAQFTVLEVSGIVEMISGVQFTIRTNPTGDNLLHVELTTPKSGMVDLTLHDITGREIKQLSSGNQSQGEHHFDYDITAMASGVYLVKLATAEGEMIRRVVIE